LSLLYSTMLWFIFQGMWLSSRTRSSSGVRTYVRTATWQPRIFSSINNQMFLSMGLRLGAFGSQELRYYLPVLVTYINNSLHLARKYTWIFARDMICSAKRTIFRGRSSIKLWASRNRYCSRTNIWTYFQSHWIGPYFVYYPFKFFRNMRGLKVGEYHTERVYSVTWRISTNRVQTKILGGL